MRFLFVALVLLTPIPVFTAAGCSGSSSAGPAADAGAKDATSTDAGANPGDSASDAQDCLALGATSDSCRSCCATAYATGYDTFGNLTLACACAGSYCGPSEAGAPDANVGDGGDAGGDAGQPTDDGGLFGQASCAQTCNGMQDPDTACSNCIDQTLGNETVPGPCGLDVVTTCLPDTDCSAYFSCVENCPFPM